MSSQRGIAGNRAVSIGTVAFPETSLAQASAAAARPSKTQEVQVRKSNWHRKEIAKCGTVLLVTPIPVFSSVIHEPEGLPDRDRRAQCHITKRKHDLILLTPRWKRVAARIV